MKKQLTFWLPGSWNNTTTPRSHPRPQTSDPQTQPKSPRQDQQQPPPPHETQQPSSASDASSPLPRTRSQRTPLPSGGTVPQQSPASNSARRPAQQPTSQAVEAVEAVKRPSPSREVAQPSLLSRTMSTATQRASKTTQQTDEVPKLHDELTTKTSRNHATLKDASETLLPPQVTLSHKPQHPEPEPFPSKRLPSNHSDVLATDHKPSQPTKIVDNPLQKTLIDSLEKTKHAEEDKPLDHSSEITDRPKQKFGPRSMPPDSLEKSPSHPNEHSKLEIKPGNNKLVDKKEENRDINSNTRSSAMKNLENLPGKNSVRSEKSELKASDINKQEKHETTKTTSKEPVTKPIMLINPHPTNAKPKKRVTISETAQQEKLRTLNQVNNNSFNRKETKTSNSASDEEQISLQKVIKKNISRSIQNLGIGGESQLQTEESDHSICIITLSGENKGASMVINSRHGNHPTTTATTSEITQVKKEEKPNDDRSESTITPIRASINSNTQSINNSILQNSSCTERSPGVYFILTDPKHAKSKSTSGDSSQLTHKPKPNPILKAQRLTHQPTASRRRGLKVLLAESSDSSDV